MKKAVFFAFVASFALVLYFVSANPQGAVAQAAGFLGPNFNLSFLTGKFKPVPPAPRSDMERMFADAIWKDAKFAKYFANAKTFEQAQSIAFGFAKHGLRKVSTPEMAASAKIHGDLLAEATTDFCASFFRPTLADADQEAHASEMFMLIGGLPATSQSVWIQQIKTAMEKDLEQDDRADWTVDPASFSAAVEKAGSLMPSGEKNRFVAAARNAQKISKEEACWAAKQFYKVAAEDEESGWKIMRGLASMK